MEDTVGINYVCGKLEEDGFREIVPVISEEQDQNLNNDSMPVLFVNDSGLAVVGRPSLNYFAVLEGHCNLVDPETYNEEPYKFDLRSVGDSMTRSTKFFERLESMEDKPLGGLDLDALLENSNPSCVPGLKYIIENMSEADKALFADTKERGMKR